MKTVEFDVQAGSHNNWTAAKMTLQISAIRGVRQLGRDGVYENEYSMIQLSDSIEYRVWGTYQKTVEKLNALGWNGE